MPISEPRLPTLGGDDDDWGRLLNDFLAVSHDVHGTLLSSSVSGAGGALTSNNLSDLASTSTARTNLGLGGAALLNVGTTSGTVAAGDDSRLIGAFQAANVDTDGTLAANSDSKVASQKAAKTYIDGAATAASNSTLSGAVNLRSPNLSNWFAKYDAVVKGTGVAKVLVIGDSISSFYGVNSWPGLLHGFFQSHRITEGDGAVLGSRFPNTGSLSTNSQTTTIAGTYNGRGAGAQSSQMSDGQEFTQTFFGDAITIIYGTGAAAGTGLTGGTISVYDGPSSGTPIATVDASLGGTQFSQLLDVTFGSNASRTVTVHVTGGTGTLIEQVVPHCGTLTQGVDLRVATRFGFATTSYLDPSDPNANQSYGPSNSHALALISSWQPDLVINALGQNDGGFTNWNSFTTSLYNSIFSVAANTNILTVLMYSTNNTNNRGGWIDAAQTIAAAHAGKVETLSLPLEMGTLDKLINRYGSYITTDDGIHPTTPTNYMMMFPIAAKLSGDPFAVLTNLPAILPNMGVTWTGNLVGNVTGSVTGNVSGVVNRPSLVVTGSRAIDNTNDIGKVLFYNGSSDITLTLNLSGSYFNPLQTSTDFVQLGSGKITVDASVWSTAGFPVVGPNSTAQAGDRLMLRMITSPNLTTFSRISSNVSNVPRVSTLTVSGSTYTINSDTTDLAIINSPTANFTVTASGTPGDGQNLSLRVVNGSTPYTPTWNSLFISSPGYALPSSYTASSTITHSFMYNAAASAWELIGIDNPSAASATQFATITPAYNNLLGWTMSSLEAGSNATLVSGRLYLFKIMVPTTISVTNITVAISNAGSGLTSGQNFMGLYSSSGTLIGTTADQTTNFSSTGIKVAALIGGPYTITGGSNTFVWVAFVANGTTLPKPIGSGIGVVGLANLGLTAATYRGAYNGTASTALPSSITPSSNSSTSNVLVFFGIS